ncbi:MAG: preprotein translocase subunit SecG [Candidatus Komeilibacteria bacterium]
MEKIIQIIQAIVAVLLIVTIIMQNKGAGLGSAFGGESTVYRTKRGAEKTIYYTTIILAILFLGLTLADLFIN